MAKEQVYEITVVYKSGATLRFNVTAFEISPSRGSTTYTWTVAPGEKRSPVLLGVDEIAAIWQRVL